MIHKTKSFGRFFITAITQAQGAPIFDRACTVETEGAMRKGDGWCIRPPFTKHRPVRALVVGLWRKPRAPLPDCAGGTRCSGCESRQQCAHGCIRMLRGEPHA